MAAANVCDSSILMVSVIHGTFQYGIAIAVSFELTVQDIVLRGEGVVGPSCRGEVAKDLVAICDFLVPPPQNSNVTKAELVIVTKQADGGTTTYTLKNMTTRGFSTQFNREAPPAIHRQSFCHIGDMSVNGVGTVDTTNVGYNVA